MARVVISDLIERIVRGPAPPVGVAHIPRASFRCRIGLHLWSEVWEFTRVEESCEEVDGVLVHSARFAVKLDRECDYRTCARCDRFGG